MTRPGFTPKALIAAAVLLGIGAWAPLASAAVINPNGTATAYYRLTASSSLPVPAADIDGPQVVALVSPAGGVAPPTNADGSQGSPLTVLPGSRGFDADQLVVALKDATDASGNPEQLLGLVFFGTGLGAGGQLDFALSIDKALVDDPPTLTSSTPGITIAAIADPTSDPGTGGGATDPGDSGSTPNVPEPVGFMLWSAAAGAIALRARSRVRASRAASA